MLGCVEVIFKKNFLVVFTHYSGLFHRNTVTVTEIYDRVYYIYVSRRRDAFSGSLSRFLLFHFFNVL